MFEETLDLSERIQDRKNSCTIIQTDGIRILSFGPMFKVVQPDHFVNLIKERLRKQKSSQLFFHDKKHISR